MRMLTWALLLAMLVMVMPAVAQEEAPAAGEVPAMPKDMAERMERFKQMGMDEKGALFMSVLSSSGMDPAQLILLMALMDKGGGGGGADARWLVLFMSAMGGKQEGKQAVVLDRDESLLIIEDGVLYVLDVETMELKGSVAYGQGTQSNTEALMSLLSPIMSRRAPAPPPVEEEGAVEEETEQAASRRKLRQLATAFHMYAADFDGSLPVEQWVEWTKAYRDDNDVLFRPSEPGLPVGYAMNEKLIGAKLADIEEPAETVVLFESNIGGGNPVGGPEAVPEEGVHNGGIMCGFVDGHVKWLRVERARDLLEQDPF